MLPFPKHFPNNWRRNEPIDTDWEGIVTLSDENGGEMQLYLGTEYYMEVLSIYAKLDPPTCCLKMSRATRKHNHRAIQNYEPSIEHGNEQ